MYPVIVAAADGVWFVSTDGVGKMTASGSVQDHPVAGMHGTAAMTMGSDGALWAADEYAIWRITASGEAKRYVLPSGFAAPNGITAGPDGNIWVINGNAMLLRLTPGGAFTEFQFPDQNCRTSDITTGKDGNIWAITPNGIDIVKFSPSMIPSTGVLSSSSLAFAGTAGGPPPAPQTLTVTGANESFEVSAVAPSPSWLSVSPTGNVLANQTMTVGVNPTGLSPGSYVGSILLTSGSITQVVQVSYNVTAASNTPPSSHNVSVSPASFAFNSAVSASQLVVSNSNPQAGAINFTASTSGGYWLALGPTTGTIPATAPYSVSIPVSVNSTGLAAGSYNATITISPTGGTPVNVPVTLTVASTGPPAVGGNVSVSTTSFAFKSAVSTSELLISQLVISNSNPQAGTINFTASTSGGNWLVLGATSGTIPAASPYSVTIPVSVNTAGLAAGSYNATITITPAGGTTVNIPVTLTVASTAPPSSGGNVSVSPASFAFSSAVSTGQLVVSNPDPQAGAINFTASISGGNWLVLGATSGTIHAAAPYSVTIPVSVNSTGLAAGSYNATITISPSGGATVNVPVVLTVTAAPSTVVVSAVVNAASFLPGAIAPGEIVTIGGSGLGPVSPFGLILDSNGKVSTSLGGVKVSFNGYAAPLIYASANQINCVVPYEIDGATNVVAEVDFGGQSGTFALKATATQPGIFTFDGSGAGIAAAANSTGGYNGTDNPAAPGSTIVLYLTGEGATTPKGVTGNVTSVDTSPGDPLTPQSQMKPTVTIGGFPAAVAFYGEAPGMVAGVMQLNVQVPNGLLGGNQPLSVSFGTSASQNGVKVSVR
ncbi:MAG TPA: hypothetical protein VG675_07095 [Bryobacteraceae bacterium]|nr:hypothetical protein [Bryobacteraceae bacterium]